MMHSIFEHTEHLADEIPGWIESAGVPGLSLAVVEHGGSLWTQGFGVLNMATGTPVTTDSLFQAASLSKPLFAYAVMRLCDAGVLNLDRPLGDYLPAPYDGAEPRIQKLTARQILSHSTGLQNWRFEPDEPLEFAFEPGERFRYSGEGYFYLQYVLEQITGQGIEHLMHDQVFTPLNMPQSTYSWRPEVESRLAWGHSDQSDPVEPWNAWQGRQMEALARDWQMPLATWRYEDVKRALPLITPMLPALPNNVIPNVAGSLLTTAAEYAQLLLRLLEPSGRDRAHLLPTTHALMLTSQVAINPVLSWGLGLGLEQVAERRVFWHWGDNGVFQSFVVGDRAQQHAVVIMTNSGRGLKVCARIVRWLLGYESAAFSWI